MKKKLFLFLAMTLLLVCAFAMSINAETVLKPQDNNAYGELSFFDESITVGRTNTKYGFTPYMDEAGTYARVVVGDGTTFYTFPTAYVLSNSAIYGDGQKSIMVLDFSSLNSAMQTATGTNPNWGKANIYRIELPKNMQLLNAGNQNFQSCSNVIEIYLQPNSTLKDQNKNMVFWRCYKLETIHNLDTFVFRSGSTGGAFQDCRSLTNITIGVSYEVTDSGDNMFNGCTNLQTVNFNEAFPNLKTVGKSAFNGCTNLKKISLDSDDYTVTLSDNVTTLTTCAFQACSSIKNVYVGKNVSNVSSDVFRGCTNLENIVVTGKVTSITTNTFKDSNNIKTICYVGEKGKAESFISSAKNSGGNTIISTLSLISYNDYNALESKEGLYFIYDYNFCVAYKNGIHELDPENSNACAGVCLNCEQNQLASNPIHKYDTTLVYANYLANGVKTQTCQNEGCAHKTTPVVTSVAPIITSFKGFSVKEDGNGITFGYTVDYDALAEFEEVNLTKVELGFAVAVKSFLGDKSPLDENGDKASDNVIKVAVNDEYNYVGADFVLRGNWDKTTVIDGVEVDVKNVEFYMAGYLITNGTVTYLNGNGSSANAGVITFNSCNTAE